ncbi:hypothetical protein N8I77_011391 [Diaporthe amygdali]|uniref:Uncharacterized protein n=1 Tax=Phomopsis amygdali TaxID=1214568 RepID=A0AAD9S675_PHOAM|nr:hypothetical protein N8I77_011391 [Diaporthe amygdali]
MAPLLNTTLICNSTSACASALVKVQEQLDDAERLSYILGALLGIVFLLFVCSPLIFNLPKEDETSRTAPSPENNEIEMRDLGSGGEMPDPNDFVINEEEADISQVAIMNQIAVE